MSVRGGAGPRDPMAGPEPASRHRKSAYQRTGRYGRGPGDQRRFEGYGDGRGLGGMLRFVIFLVVMAVLVLLVMVTVARPVLRMVVVPWSDGNPGSLRIGFVAELVREDLGATLTAAREHQPRLGGVRRAGRRHAGDPGAAPRGGRDHHQPARLPVRGRDAGPRLPAQRRAVRHDPGHDAGRCRERPHPQPHRERDRQRDVPGGSAPRADHRQADDGAGVQGRSAGVLRPRDQADRCAARRLPVAAGSLGPPQGGIAGGVPVPGHVHPPHRSGRPDHGGRPGPDDAGRVLRAGWRRWPRGREGPGPDLPRGPHPGLDRRARGRSRTRSGR